MMAFYVEPYYRWGSERFIVVAAKQGPEQVMAGPFDDEEEAEALCLAFNVMAGAA